MNITFKDIDSSDIDLHKDLIYIALWDHPDEPRRPRSVLDDPKVKAYYEDWGQSGDIGIFAMLDDKVMGFIQSRFKESVTEKHADLPEIAIAIFPEFHGCGVASTLFKELIRRVEPIASGLRLGVNPRNEIATKLYEKFDFYFYETPAGRYPQMVLEFN